MLGDQSEDERLVREIAEGLMPVFENLPQMLAKLNQLLDRCRPEWVARLLTKHLTEEGKQKVFLEVQYKYRFTTMLTRFLEEMHKMMVLLEENTVTKPKQIAR